MFRRWKTILREASSHTPRRRERRFVPSISDSASCLEDRMVLSGAGHAAPAVHHAVVLSGAGHAAPAVHHAVAHHGHIAAAHSQQGRAAAVTPVAVSVSTATPSGSLATSSTTRTSHPGTVTVSPAKRLGGTAAALDFQNISLAMT